MSLISRIPPAQVQIILPCANFCHRACSISRTAAKWLIPLPILSFGYHFYKYKHQENIHNKKHENIFPNQKKCGVCKPILDRHGKYGFFSLVFFTIVALTYVTSVGMQFLSGKLIEHLEARGQ